MFIFVAINNHLSIYLSREFICFIFITLGRKSKLLKNITFIILLKLLENIQGAFYMIQKAQLNIPAVY